MKRLSDNLLRAILADATDPWLWEMLKKQNPWTPPLPETPEDLRDWALTTPTSGTPAPAVPTGPNPTIRIYVSGTETVRQSTRMTFTLDMTPERMEALRIYLDDNDVDASDVDDQTLMNWIRDEVQSDEMEEVDSETYDTETVDSSDMAPDGENAEVGMPATALQTLRDRL